jgi:hypothetical protein
MPSPRRLRSVLARLARSRRHATGLPARGDITCCSSTSTSTGPGRRCAHERDLLDHFIGTVIRLLALAVALVAGVAAAGQSYQDRTRA